MGGCPISRTTRLLVVLHLFQRCREVSFKEITDMLPVSQKTAYRDVQLLKQAELLEQAEDVCEGPHLVASKWERVNGKWESVIGFDVQRVGGVSRTTRFWPGDEKMREWGIGEDTMDLNGTRYMWLGYVDGDHLDAMPLSSDLLYCGGYRG